MGDREALSLSRAEKKSSPDSTSPIRRTAAAEGRIVLALTFARIDQAQHCRQLVSRSVLGVAQNQRQLFDGFLGTPPAAQRNRGGKIVADAQRRCLGASALS